MRNRIGWLTTSVVVLALLSINGSVRAQCTTDAQCNDNKSCTGDRCDGGTCVNTPRDGRCDDGKTCTRNVCDPSDTSSDPTTGCLFPPVDARCDDAASCTDQVCRPADPTSDPASGCVITPYDSRCTGGGPCATADCDPTDPAAESGTGCVYTPVPGCCTMDSECPDPSVCEEGFCDPSTHTCTSRRILDCCETEADCPPDPFECVDSFCDATNNKCATRASLRCRVSASQKGSLLIYPKIELRWAAGAAGALRQDTILELTNDYPDDVCVQFYFVNGDEPLDPVLDPVTGGVIVEGEPGWEWVDCQFCLTPDQTTYMSMATGAGAGCQPFTTLDPSNGAGPGRPDATTPGERHLRGFAYVWAVDLQGHAIKWNHLSGGATLVNYFNTDAWDYNAFASQAHNNCERICEDHDIRCENPRFVCEKTEHGDRMYPPGRIRMDGLNYDSGFGMLLMDFFASGSIALSPGFPPPPPLTTTIALDTDLTLHPITADLRQDSIGPLTTKAEFAIWNEEERRFSNTTRCITCWDQTLLSVYAQFNHFLRANLQTDKGKARIDGVRSNDCDLNCVREDATKNGLDIDFILDILGIDHVCSFDASLLGVVAKVLAFSGGATGRATAGRTLVGMDREDAWIKWDIIAGPGTAQDGVAGLRNGRKVVKTPTPVREAQLDSARPLDPIDIPSE